MTPPLDVTVVTDAKSSVAYEHGDPVPIVIGPPGPRGPTGPQGNTVLSGSGPPSSSLGVDGDYYIDNTAHAIYGPKTSGAWGSPTSLVGPMGPRGYSVLNGAGPPSGATGVDNDFYIDTTAHAIYGPKTAGAWGSPTSLIGPKGDKGDQGIPGGGASVLDTPFGPSWDGITNVCPSLNSVYDEFVKRPVLAPGTTGQTFTGYHTFDVGGGYNVKLGDAADGYAYFSAQGDGPALQMRSHPGKKGLIEFIEDTIAIRWTLGTKPSDGYLYFMAGDSGYTLSAPQFSIAPSGDVVIPGGGIYARAPTSVFGPGSGFAVADTYLYFDNTNYTTSLIFRSSFGGGAFGQKGSLIFSYGGGLGAFYQSAGYHYFRDQTEAKTFATINANGLDATGALNRFGPLTGTPSDSFLYIDNTNYYSNLVFRSTSANTVSMAATGQIASSIYASGTLFYWSNLHTFRSLGGGTTYADIDATGINIPTGATYKINGVPIGGGGGLTDGDKGDVVVGGGGTTLTVESATPAGGTFAVTGAQTVTGAITASDQVTTQGVNAGVNLSARDSSANFVLYANANALNFYASGATRLTLTNAGVATFTGKAITVASAAGGAGLNLPQGAAPSAPVNGDMWTTSAALFYRLNGATKTSAVLEGNTFTGKNTTVASAAGGAGFNLPPGAAPTAPVDGDIWLTSTGVFARVNGVTKQNAFVDSNITGSAGSVANALTLNNAGAGAASGSTFNGAAAITLSWNTIGAAPDTPRTQAAAADSITPTFANDVVTRLAAAGAITLNNPTGTAVDSWGLVIKLRDNGTARAISYGTQWRAIGVTLPTTTVANKLIILGAVYNSTDTKWDVVAVAQEA